MILIYMFALFAITGISVAAWRYWNFARKWLIGIGAVVSLALGLLTYPVSLGWVQQGAVSGYQQDLNGNLINPQVIEFGCERDGVCANTYSCDPYTVEEIETYTDSKGNTQTRTVEETKYHDCPYTTNEYTYTLDDTLGDHYVLGDHIFAADPQPWRPSDDEGIPSDVARGVPPHWQHAKLALAAGNADPVNVVRSYKNYILATDSASLRSYSADIDRYKADQLLPKLSYDVHDTFLTNKVYFEGFTPPNAAAWQDALMHFDSALGTKLQGDMRIVVVKASAIKDSEDYLNALKAYWLNDMGKSALAKNGILVVIGVDDSGSYVQWARATTGMPIGNGAMLTALELQLPGSQLNPTPFTPDTIIGTTQASVSYANGKPKPQYALGNGIIENIVMVQEPFARACMDCSSTADKGKEQQGFTYLSSEIPLSTDWAMVAVLADLAIYLAIFGLLKGADSFFAPMTDDYARRTTSSIRDRWL